MCGVAYIHHKGDGLPAHDVFPKSVLLSGVRSWSPRFKVSHRSLPAAVSILRLGPVLRSTRVTPNPRNPLRASGRRPSTQSADPRPYLPCILASRRVGSLVGMAEVCSGDISRLLLECQRGLSSRQLVQHRQVVTPTVVPISPTPLSLVPRLHVMYHGSPNTTQ